jgi:glycosyltransferase 2 family protein
VKTKLIRWGKAALKIALSAAALAWVFSRIDYRHVGEVLLTVNVWFLLPAILLFTASKVVSSFRLNEFFRCIEIKLDEWANLRLYWLGMFYNLFLPGGIGGDGYKIYLLHQRTGIKAKSIFWAVLLDRVSGVLALFWLAVLIFLIVPVVFPFKYLVILLLPLSWLAFRLFLKWLFPEYLPSMNKLNLQAFAVQSLQVLSAAALLASLGVFTQYPEFLFLFLLSSIVATLPITIGGIGSREITFLFGAEYLHLNMNISVGVSLLFYLTSALVSLFGIYYSLLPSRLRVLDNAEKTTA